jgi:glycosyltransferase involved in cell wall biosynthesis
MFPQAPVFTAVCDMTRLPPRFAELDVRTSFLQRVPFSRRRYDAIVPLMPFAFENFDLRGFDLILSSSHACAKGVIPPPSAQHICYCHTPMRYAWTHQQDYLARAPVRPLTAPLARVILTWLRQWDFTSAQRVDHYIANSQNVRQRIAKFYRREADVVYPPVEVDRFPAATSVASTSAPYLVVGRLTEYKRVEVAVAACNKLRLPLRVIGRGPELKRLSRLAGPTITFEGEIGDAELSAAFRSCRALIFTADEDFGMVPVEAMASGRPVIALGLGGVTESVVAGVTGEFYADGGVDPLIDALEKFRPEDYSPQSCRDRAIEFSPERFRDGAHAVIARFLGGSTTDDLLHLAR